MLAHHTVPWVPHMSEAHCQNGTILPVTSKQTGKSLTLPMHFSSLSSSDPKLPWLVANIELVSLVVQCFLERLQAALQVRSRNMSIRWPSS